MDDLLVGVDLGTSACKATLLRADDGQILAASSLRYEPSSPRSGWIEQDPRTWYDATVSVVRDLLASGHGAAGMVRGLGIAGQMRGLVLVDERGCPVRPAILWNDNRCSEEVAEITGPDLDRLTAITRNVLNTMCTLPKLLWLRRHESASLRAAARMLYPKDYVRLRLCGTLATDLSDAAGSSLFDVAAQAWSTELLERFAIEPGLLPEVRVATDVVGGLPARAARELGLPPGTPVIVGGSDSAVESFSIGLTGPDSCKIRLGTSGAVSTVVDGLADTGRAYVWSFVRPDRWMLDTNTRACGGAVAWLRGLMYSGISRDDDAYAAIDREAASVPVGAEGLLFHPYLLGEDAPYWDPLLRASFSGLHPSHRRPHLARAVLEGTALALRDAISTLGPWVEGFGRHIFVGGGTASPTWLSVVADAIGVDGEVPEAADASLGAAMLAGVGVGTFRGLDECVDRCYRIKQRVHHDADRTRCYDELFERYLRDRPRSAPRREDGRGRRVRRAGQHEGTQ
jgi:xylulokinase